VVPLARTFEKPSTARCGRRARETLWNICTPSGDHICTTMSSLPLALLSASMRARASSFDSGVPERSDSAICCMW